MARALDPDGAPGPDPLVESSPGIAAAAAGGGGGGGMWLCRISIEKGIGTG